MSPSGGQLMYHFRLRMVALSAFATTLVCLLPLQVAGKDAKDAYYMDQNSDCFSAGFQSVARDQVVNVFGKSTGSPDGRLECRIMFEPETKGDTLKVIMDPVSKVNDDGVQFTASITGENGRSFTFGSESVGVPDHLESMNGKATLFLRVPGPGADFTLHLTVAAEQTIDRSSSGSSSSVNSGLVVGLVVTALIIIIVVAIIVGCLVKKRKQGGDTADGGGHAVRTWEKVEHNEKASSAGSNLSLSNDRRSIDF